MSAAPATDMRRRELGAIHIARKELALTEDAYRACISRVSGGSTESSADLNETQRRALLDYFKKLGFGQKAKQKKTIDQRPQAAKLRALWYALYELGVVDHQDDEALTAFVRRHTGIDALRWNNVDHLSRAIECLKSWGSRFGWAAKPCKGNIVAFPMEGRFEPGLIRAQWERLKSLGGIGPGDIAELADWLLHQCRRPDPRHLDPESAGYAVKVLGTRIRQAKAKAGAGDG